ncbi:TetR/AcrR family transcriptional regulator [Pseudomonas mucidolens]|uniref:TetR/AcrR family transcriptional regulator n=1 Tax=Pseudomonas mucidolens TaxID=46679 RepID=UPI0030D932BF
MTSPRLTPAAERIVQLALQHFANRGYDAASLNDIAVSAGIRKASLYAHFTGKDELYCAVLDLALKSEQDYVDGQFSAATRDRVPGERYVNHLQRRFGDSSALRFLLRAAFYPPAPIEQKVKAAFEHYLAGIAERFQAALKRACPDLGLQQSNVLAEAYLALIDSLHVELIYGNAPAYARRLNALRQLINLIDVAALAGIAPSEQAR